MTPEDFYELLNSFSLEYIKEKKNIQTNPLHDLLEIYNKRIFKFGKNTHGSDIGNYGVKWHKVRSEEGLQVEFVDLKFSGELRDSIKIIKNKDESIIEIGEILKANYQEQLQGKKAGSDRMDIFTVSKDEEEETIRLTEEIIDSIFDDILNKYE